MTDYTLKILPTVQCQWYYFTNDLGRTIGRYAISDEKPLYCSRVYRDNDSIFLDNTFVCRIDSPWYNYEINDNYFILTTSNLTAIYDISNGINTIPIREIIGPLRFYLCNKRQYIILYGDNCCNKKLEFICYNLDNSLYHQKGLLVGDTKITNLYETVICDYEQLIHANDEACEYEDICLGNPITRTKDGVVVPFKTERDEKRYMYIVFY